MAAVTIDNTVNAIGSVIDNGIILVLVLLVILFSINIILVPVIIRVRVINDGILFSNDDLSVVESVDLRIKNMFTSVGYVLPSADGEGGAGTFVVDVVSGQTINYTVDNGAGPVERVVFAHQTGTLKIVETGTVRNLRV